MTRRARLTVDPIACDGRGLCAELLPDQIRLDDWGFPVITDADIPAGLRGEAAAVVRLCPRLALRLERPPPAPPGPNRPGPKSLEAGARRQFPAVPLPVATKLYRFWRYRAVPGVPDDEAQASLPVRAWHFLW